MKGLIKNISEMYPYDLAYIERSLRLVREIAVLPIDTFYGKLVGMRDNSLLAEAITIESFVGLLSRGQKMEEGKKENNEGKGSVDAEVFEEKLC